VNALLASGEAGWCAPIRLELWRGVTDDAERRILRRYDAVLPDHPITGETWNLAIRFADRARATGLTVPMADLLIFACAKLHGCHVAHDDDHFERLATLTL
jgi:predicted nucleic acid-binding protein